MSAVALRAVESAVFEIEYLVPGAAERREALSQCWNVRFEDAPPVRAFPSMRGLTNFAGFRWCATTGGHVGYESWLERAHLLCLDFDSRVVGVASQPFWLRWHDGVRRRRHAPDYFVRHADGSAVVIDVRPDDRIGVRDAQAFSATAEACDLAGWEYRRVGELDPVLVANLSWLSGYRHSRCFAPDAAHALTRVFARPRGLLDGAAAAGETLAVLPVLYHLLWRRELTCDLTGQLLGPDTLVWEGSW